MAKTIKQGDRIYIEELKQYGIAWRVDNGKVTKAQVTTDNGYKIIEVATLTVRVVTLIKEIFRIIKSWWG